MTSLNVRGLRRLWLALMLGVIALMSALTPALAAPKEGDTKKGPSPYYVERKHDEAGVKCEDCHAKDKKSVAVPVERCATCHIKGDLKALVTKTANVKPVNPHENRHYGNEADCGICHMSHDDPVNFCADCHPRYQFKIR